MWLRICPPMLVKSPPAKILPSACTAIEKTPLFAFGLNESARPVAASSRAMLLRACPPMLVKKSPPAKILPSACTRDGMDIVRVRVERISQTGRGIEPGDVIARLSADAGEIRRPLKSCRPPAPRWQRSQDRSRSRRTNQPGRS